MSTTVLPVSAHGWNVTWFKWTIRCGACPATFKARLSYVDHPTVRCPHCGAWNEIGVVVSR